MKKDVFRVWFIFPEAMPDRWEVLTPIFNAASAGGKGDGTLRVNGVFLAVSRSLKEIVPFYCPFAMEGLFL